MTKSNNKKPFYYYYISEISNKLILELEQIRLIALNFVTTTEKLQNW